MRDFSMHAARAALVAALLCAGGCATSQPPASRFELVGAAAQVGVGAISSEYTEIRLTISPDGATALWGSTNRPGGPGGWNIWMSRRGADGAWGAPAAVSFNTDANEFDPAFSPDGAFVYFFSNREGGFGGDDIYRVPVRGDRFGEAEHLGPEVNSAGSEFAPIISPDGRRLMFSSDGRGGAGRQDLFFANVHGRGFEQSAPVAGGVNTSADEFDATWLSDNETIVFARAPDLSADRIDLYVATLQRGAYDGGVPLSLAANSTDSDTLGAVIDWSRPSRLLFSARRTEANAGRADVYAIEYRLAR
jgi:hypothetical protein